MFLQIDVKRSLSSLDALLNMLELHDPRTSFGSDIDEVQAQLLAPDLPVSEKAALLFAWVARFQPCLFGRMGARGKGGIGIDICWIDQRDIAAGDEHVAEKIRLARRAWKNNAERGEAHGFLIMFNDSRLAHARPGASLLAACEKVSNLYLPEYAPIERDVIYTEAIPLRMAEGLRLFKAGINLFYPSAHRTRNHDRRLPGGMLISVNSPGHLANSLLARGLVPSLEVAVEHMMNLALRSIGNGGISHPHSASSSWHNIETSEDELRRRCTPGSLPHYVPENHSQSTYSALYHTDVLVPTDVTVDSTIDPDRAACEHWKWLILGYITTKEYPPDHVNYALFHGHPIAEEAKYFNPWPPRRAYNAPLSNY